jgi:uncharacterized OsmC-like protein
MGAIRVSHVAGDQFQVDIRGHTLVVDQPTTEGGADGGPTPTELFVAGLVTCVAHYARGYLTRHGFDETGLRVSADWDFAGTRPARVGHVRILIEPPSTLPAERRAAMLAVASHCTVHNSLEDPPAVEITLTDESDELAAS